MMPAPLKPMWGALGELLGEAAGDSASLPIAGISSDSRRVRQGDLFLACAGRSSHGLQYLAGALEAGAVAVAWEVAAGVEPPELPAEVVAVPIRGLGERLGAIADRFYASPSRSVRIVAVTGTNGKTSCTFLIANALERAGRSCGLLGTLGYGRPGSLAPATHTTPDPITMHSELASLRDDGLGYAAMEVSSHALDQGRVNSVHVDTAVFTNLSRDHLDYHRDLKAYARAKGRLFSDPALPRAVINLADPFGVHMLRRLPPGTESVGVWTQTPGSETPGSVKPRAFACATSVFPHAEGLRMSVESTWGRGELRSPLIGAFNAENLLVALAVLLSWGLDWDQALAALADCPAAPGRMEAFRSPHAPLGIVDYAHTPDALAKGLRAARDHCRGDLWCVFGCGGDRDQGKRPLMGGIALRLADRVVVTDDNPRGEDPDAIVSDILSGMPDPARAVVERDRREAISSAVAEARADDVVFVAGKGHEEWQIIGGERHPFSDRELMAGLMRGSA